MSDRLGVCGRDFNTHRLFKASRKKEARLADAAGCLKGRNATRHDRPLSGRCRLQLRVVCAILRTHPQARLSGRDPDEARSSIAGRRAINSPSGYRDGERGRKSTGPVKLGGLVFIILVPAILRIMRPAPQCSAASAMIKRACAS